MEVIDKILFEIGIRDHVSVLKVKYGIEIVKTEASKALIMLVVFSLIDKGVLFLYTLLVMAPLRSFSGGFHLKTKIGCFLFSFAIIFAIMILLPMLNFPKFVFGILMLISSAFIIYLAPVYTKKRPVETKERYIYLKKKSIMALLFSLATISIMFILELQQFFVVGVWTITVQATQLIISKFFYWKGGLRNDFNIEKTSTSC